MTDDWFFILILIVLIGGFILCLPKSYTLMTDTYTEKGLLQYKSFCNKPIHPNLKAIKSYIETGYHESICNGDSFWRDIHLWVGVCKGHIKEVQEQEVVWSAYKKLPKSYIDEYLKEVYTYQKLKEKSL